MFQKKTIKIAGAWLKKHYEIVLAFATAVGLVLVVQLIGCNETRFTYAPPTTCADIDLEELIDASCDTISSPEGITEGGCDGCQPFSTPEGLEGFVEVSDSDGSGRNDPTGTQRVSPRGESGGYAPVTPREPERTRLAMNRTIPMGRVDILFVVDNSRSMHVEHTKIASQFDQFLDDIRDLDYHIAIMTADMSDSPDNRRRDYQDGRFIEFDNGDLVLFNYEEGRDDERSKVSRSHHNENINLFKQAIQRPESIECVNNEDECTDDEQAICALNTSLDISSQNYFHRKGSHLMVIVVSDEDERSSEEDMEFKNKRLGIGDYSYTSCNDPYELYRNILNKISPYKSMSFHAIIVKPGDKNCLNSQRRNNNVSHYGELYAELAKPLNRTVRERYPSLRMGSLISICEDSYSSQLEKLSKYLVSPIPPIHLTCIPASLRLRIKGGNRDGDPVEDFRVEGQTLIVEDDRVPLTSMLSINIVCGSGS